MLRAHLVRKWIFRVRNHPLVVSRVAIKNICCQESANKSRSLYSQSLDIPTERHFLNLQYWHRFRLSRITRHFPSRKHRYSICFWMLLLKNPWKNEINNLERAFSGNGRFYPACLPRTVADERQAGLGTRAKTSFAKAEEIEGPLLWRNDGRQPVLGGYRLPLLPDGRTNYISGKVTKIQRVIVAGFGSWSNWRSAVICW